LNPKTSTAILRIIKTHSTLNTEEVYTHSNNLHKISINSDRNSNRYLEEHDVAHAYHQQHESNEFTLQEIKYYTYRIHAIHIVDIIQFIQIKSRNRRNSKMVEQVQLTEDCN